MNCEQARESLELLSAGSLSGDDARDVRMHLASCASCAGGMRNEDWVEVLPALDETIEPSGDFASRFHARLKSHPKPWWRNIAVWGWPRQMAAVGTLAAVILAGILMIRSYEPRLDRAPYLNDFGVAENLPLLEDMAVITNLDLLENFDIIEDLPSLIDQGEKN
jgi:hypothetical protein